MQLQQEIKMVQLQKENEELKKQISELQDSLHLIYTSKYSTPL